MTKLRAGDWVEVRTKEEILSTLDKNGRLDELPFMPQMFKYCGKRFKVYKRSHKTCDTVTNTGGRWLPNGIHLDLRCDGEAYGGCQAACLIFWKEAWLRPVTGSANPAESSSGRQYGRSKHCADARRCTEEDIDRGTRVLDGDAGGEIRYSCQATELPRFTTLLRWWDARQYVEDYTSGNASLGRLARGFIYLAYWHLALAKRARLGHVSRLVYDFFQELRGGVPFPRWKGTIPHRHETPTVSLNLQPGELVRVKTYKEILATVDSENINRGMAFDAELVPYCGGVYKVKTQVTKFIDEKTGKMRSLKTPAVILEDVWCRSRYSNCKMFCPRSIYSWWREVWLERISDGADAPRLATDPCSRERLRLKRGESPHASSDIGKVKAMEH
ncbi:hypothetical protein [Bradyrhizobium sp. 164]|uniref:hypothetical protein n=1 Tax=Bradyrhizobium sp. 164 TaxID=2782637 RepID=UPI001FFB589D|nr:hypothetical protein [Bradyrhizobium sp. 164]MCK1597309.1 hypothetical protein [Bradyrhizobium sp. 164]